MKLCSKCKSNPALSYHAYCYGCLRESKGQPPVPKFRRDSSNKTKCSRCKIKPRLKYHRYCQECKNQSRVDWERRHGGSWKSLSPEGRRKATVRAFINHKVHRGQIDRKPCMVCGNPSEFHHVNYKPRTLDVLHVCSFHHDEIERMKKQGLTDHQAVDYLLHQLSDSPTQPPTG